MGFFIVITNYFYLLFRVINEVNNILLYNYWNGYLLISGVVFICFKIEYKKLGKNCLYNIYGN